jgi:hypothetical protein
MNETYGAAGAPIPADVVPRLTDVAAGLAAQHKDPQPTSIAAVATTRAKALEVLMGYGPNARRWEGADMPVYAVVMTGRFESPRGGPPSRQPPLPLAGKYLTVVIEAATLLLRDVGVGDKDPRAPLGRLGPVIRLT